MGDLLGLVDGIELGPVVDVSFVLLVGVDVGSAEGVALGVCNAVGIGAYKRMVVAGVAEGVAVGSCGAFVGMEVVGTTECIAEFSDGAFDRVEFDNVQLPIVFDSDPLNLLPEAVSIPLTRIIYAPSP